MATMVGAVRRRIITPDMSETKFSVRGFQVKDEPSREMFETVGRQFLTGYGLAAEAARSTDAERGLEQIPDRFRGFAYEGAAMAFAVRDGLPFGGQRHVTDFLAGRAARHVYMAYVGMGWALGRVPRFRWAAATRGATDRLLRWLVLDGYGFHQAYFHTDKYVHQHFREPRFPWPADDRTGYADRAIDQGIGRAMWFVGCADPDLVATLIERFPAQRHADLFSGAGLAATYAGGLDEAELGKFAKRAGRHLPYVAQAGAFACTARIEAGLLGPHSELAAQVLCGMTAADADQLSARLRPTSTADVDGVPAYEVWRQRIAEHVAVARGLS